MANVADPAAQALVARFTGIGGVAPAVHARSLYVTAYMTSAVAPQPVSFIDLPVA